MHKFWSTQPVPQTEGTDVNRVGPVEKQRTVEEVSQDPLAIASTLEWWTPKIEEKEDLRAIYELLRDNYVEDDSSMFRFNYKEEFLEWAMTPPGYYPDWHVAIRRKRDKALMGFVSGVPMTIRMGTPKAILEQKKINQEEGYQQEEKKQEENYLEPRRICEINFLCVHKHLRDKRLAPILIQEVTRRVNLTNIWQAIYTAGKVLPTPFATAHYFHRSLNPEKLVAIQFSRTPEQYERFQNPTMMLKRFYYLPDKPKTKGLRPMEMKDVPEVGNLLRETLAKYDVAPVFSDEEVAHYLLPREGVVVTYVVERDCSGDAETGKASSSGSKNNKDDDKCNHKKITDFFSFFSLPSTVIGSTKYSTLNAAYIFYYAANSIPLSQLINDLLIVAHSMGYDVCNTVDNLDNHKYLNELKFAPGDGNLHYYFYNWSYPTVPHTDIGLVMM